MQFFKKFKWWYAGATGKVLLQEGATYHVTAKINRGEHIFESDEIKNLFMDTVKRAKKKYKFSIKNFVIMNNHIHFLIEPAKKKVYHV